MVTNKGLFFAALTLGLCIILASIIGSMATFKAGKMRGMQSQMGERDMPGCDMMGQRGDDRREEMRGDRRERDEDGEEDGEFRGMRRGRRDFSGMQQFRGERNDWQRGDDREDREDREEGPRGMRHGGGGMTPETDGNGYLFN